MNEEEIKLIKEESLELISQLGINADLKVFSDNQKTDEVINFQIESSEPSFLIGFHGETLQALQLIFSFLCHKKLGRWVKVLVDIDGYRLKREEQLQKLALNLAMKVKFSKETQSIPNLCASERRFIHIVLAGHPDVYTESEGEGGQRTLMIKPKS